MPKRLAPKEQFLNPSTPVAPGQLKPSARWLELTDSPLFKEAVQVALTEYVVSLTPDVAQPGRVAYLIEGAKGAFNVLMNLGEPDHPGPMRKPEPRLNPQ